MQQEPEQASKPERAPAPSREVVMMPDGRRLYAYSFPDAPSSPQADTTKETP